MPRSKSWASPGGIAPTEQDLMVETNFDNSEEKGKEGTVVQDTKLQCPEEEGGNETWSEKTEQGGKQETQREDGKKNRVGPSKIQLLEMA